MTADRVIAVQDREKHNLPIYAYKVCKIFVQCSVIGGAFQENIETIQSRYFSLDELPPLAEEKKYKKNRLRCVFRRIVPKIGRQCLIKSYKLVAKPHKLACGSSQQLE